MIEKKLKMTAAALFSGLIFTSWIPPYLVQQEQHPAVKQTPQKKTEITNHHKNEEKREAKAKRRALYTCDYLTHQKNRLAYFADHDRFIWFDDKENKYSFFLSNYYPASITLWGMKFYCAEAAFQAAKFLAKPEIAVRFTHLDGEDACQLAQKLSYQQRGDWYKVRVGIMLEILQAKFDQHPELSDLLLATENAYLVENSTRDAFWADGGDGKGRNHLGKLLMRVRVELGGTGVVPKPSKYDQFVEE